MAELRWLKNDFLPLVCHNLQSTGNPHSPPEMNLTVRRTDLSKGEVGLVVWTYTFMHVLKLL